MFSNDNRLLREGGKTFRPWPRGIPNVATLGDIFFFFFTIPFTYKLHRVLLGGAPVCDVPTTFPLSV